MNKLKIYPDDKVRMTCTLQTSQGVLLSKDDIGSFLFEEPNKLWCHVLFADKHYRLFLSEIEKVD